MCFFFNYKSNKSQKVNKSYGNKKKRSERLNDENKAIRVNLKMQNSMYLKKFDPDNRVNKFIKSYSIAS